MSLPLASLLRPQNLAEFIGQTHLVGENQPLKIVIDQDKVFSMIFWGPPGVGKTTLARIIAEQTKREFFEISAVSAGKADVKKIIETARELDKAPVLFIDEIHRFNKAQQDYLLPHVENGVVILIGATTENPSFEVISALLSRTRVLVLKALDEKELAQIITKALAYLKITQVSPATKEWLINYANGDARKLITILEHTFDLYQQINVDHLKLALQSFQLRYDKGGEEHYDTISAMIKSMRASNIDAALYYLARMVESGEDPLFIARRMVVFASEDVASPTALVVANAVFQACHQIGFPECQENLAAGVVYLCQAKKDRSAYDAYMAALSDVKKYGNLPIPLNIRNAPTKLMKELDYGKGYEMYTKESLLPDKLKGKKYYSKTPLNKNC